MNIATTKPLLPWKIRFAMSILSAITYTTRRTNGTINRRLLNLIDLKIPPKANPINGVTSSDVVVDPTRNLWFRLFTPSSNSVVTASLPVILFFHGGGFAFMSPSSITYDTLCRLLCRSLNAIVISVNYRLAPEYRFPTQYDDGLEILKFIDQNYTVLGEFANVEKCFLAGDSAGGNLAHHVAIRISLEKLKVLKVIGLVSMQPFFGGEERTESEMRLKYQPVVSIDKTDWYWKMFLQDGSNREHEAVNVSGPNAMDISNVDYPNTILFVGGFDSLVDWQKRYYEWLRKSGKEVELIEFPNAIHAFYYFEDLPETSQFLSKVKDFIAKQMVNEK
ncbi:probable carboxylesterase 18 [Cicer arietinum]|uniref:Probable carboxylesterase 18 n=1 Tax=Cicer arietinum TaxID=3827 RepID=A0A1S2Z037_CICAR|nr:probable carboxylesterase 18 [Cicer arietinum]